MVDGGWWVVDGGWWMVDGGWWKKTQDVSPQPPGRLFGRRKSEVGSGKRKAESGKRKAALPREGEIERLAALATSRVFGEGFKLQATRRMPESFQLSNICTFGFLICSFFGALFPTKPAIPQDSHLSPG